MPGRRRLPRLSPHACGVDPRGIADFLDSVEQGGPEVHSLMVVRHGAVVAEGWRTPYAPELVHEMFSMTKAFTSTAVGFARDEGLVDLDDLVLDHLRDLAPEHPDPRLERMRVRHLLTMTTGWVDVLHDQLFDVPDWERAILAQPVEHEPGTQFSYTSAATYLLGAILYRRTGVGLAEYLRPRLFEPLGIEGSRWDRSPSGLENGGFGLFVTTEDLACLGQLYLDGGRWQGRQVLPEGWAEEATALQVPSVLGDIDWAQGYGYAFWQCRHGAVRGDGAFGQFTLMFPEHDAVVAITSGTPDLQGVLDRVWAHLLPALAGSGDAGSDADPGDLAVADLAAAEIAAADVAAADAGTLALEAALADRLAAWSLPTPTGPAKPAVDLTGHILALAPNAAGLTAVTVLDMGGLDTGPLDMGALDLGPLDMGAPAKAATGRPAIVELCSGERVQTLLLGSGYWASGALTVSGVPSPVAAAWAWPTPDACVVQVRWPERPYCLTIRAVIDGSRVRAAAQLNVNFHGPTDFDDALGLHS